MNEKSTTAEQKQKERIGLIQVTLSVLAAMFGVQNHEKHQRDFEQGDPIQFIVIGILFVLLFIFTLIWIVNLII
jgi:uncharacterized membrane protein YidH (DUF202 family)